MNEQNKIDSKKPPVPLAQLVGTTTSAGKPRARFTLKCNFNDGNNFTYRSDVALTFYLTKGYSKLSELEALIMKFKGLRSLTEEAMIFDNSKPQGEDIIMHFVLGDVKLNRMFIPGKQTEKYTI